MGTVGKKELVDRIAEKLGVKRLVVKRVTQQFLDEIIAALSEGNRLEIRDFGVFENKQRAARVAQNPKTMERIPIPSKRAVKFKVGRMMKLKLQEIAKAHAGRNPKPFLSAADFPQRTGSKPPLIIGHERGRGDEGPDPDFVVVWDPACLSADEYAELINLLGDLGRAHGSPGIQRIESEGFGVPSESGVAV